MDYQNVKLTKDQGIATIRLNRPDAMNALGQELVTDLASVSANSSTSPALALPSRGGAVFVGTQRRGPGIGMNR